MTELWAPIEIPLTEAHGHSPNYSLLFMADHLFWVLTNAQKFPCFLSLSSAAVSCDMEYGACCLTYTIL